MIYQLRLNDEIVCDVEVFNPGPETYIDLKASVLVLGYSALFLSNLGRAGEIVKDFYEVSELRGWLWETYFMGTQNNYTDEHYDNVNKYIKTFLRSIADKYGLYLYED